MFEFKASSVSTRIRFCAVAGFLALSAAAAHSQNALAQNVPASPAAGAAPRIEFIDGGASANLQAPHDLSPWGMYQAADWVVQSVILLLLLCSVLTWTVCVSKFMEFTAERRRLKQGLAAILQASELKDLKTVKCQAVVDLMLNAEDEIAASGRLSSQMTPEGVKERVAMRLERVEAATLRRLGRTVGLLAIIGSTAPFVGLFGTVWGIMKSFIGISAAKTTNLTVVAPGIAEALLATAFGLVAAIPAVVIYNLCSRVLSAYRGELGDASVAISCLAGRAIDRDAAAGGR